MNAACRLLAALTCAAACHAAWADRSRLDAEDAVEPGDCELELHAERMSEHGQASAYESQVELGCGVGWRTELVAALARDRAGAERAESVDLEAKVWLGVFGALSWTLALAASGERESGGSWRHTEIAAGIEAVFQLGEAWALDMEVGSVRERSEHRDTTVWTLGVEGEIADPLEARFELAGSQRSGRPLALVELRYEFWPDRARLNLSYGGRPGGAGERRVGAGVTFEF